MSKKTSYYLLASILFVYLVLRTVLNPLVYDEATTFFLYVNTNNFLPFNAHWAANNHFLNSFLVWLFTNLFGVSEFVMRLPNLLAFIFFTFYLFRIASYLKSIVLFWGLILSVFAGHAFLEMFGYARGYGLSFAFLAATLFYAIRLLRSPGDKNAILINLSVLMMVIANLTLLPVAIGVYTAAAIYFVYRKAKWQTTILHLVFGLLPLVFATLVLVELKKRELLFYSSDLGFWQGSVQSLLEAFFGRTNMFINACIIVLLAMWIIGIILRIKKGQFKWFSFYAFVSSLVFIVPLFYIASSLMLEVSYPLSRGILFLPFLFLLAFFFYYDELEWPRIPQVVVSVLIVVPLLIRFAMAASFTNATVFNWYREQIPDTFFTYVINNSKAQKATIGGYFLRQECWDFLNFKSEIKTNRLSYKQYPNNVADFLVVDEAGMHRVTNDYNVVFADEGSGLNLLKRIPSLQRQSVSNQEISAVSGLNEYSNLIRITPDKQQKYYVELSGLLQSPAKPFQGLLALSIQDEAGQSLHYQEVRFQNMFNDLDAGIQIQTGLFVAEIPEEATEMNLFLWNIKQQDFRIEKGRVKIYSLSEKNELH